MPDARGNFKGISVPDLPWTGHAPIREDDDVVPAKKCKCETCKCDLAAADQALKDGRTVQLKPLRDSPMQGETSGS